jgi:hypothetical protein
MARTEVTHHCVEQIRIRREAFEADGNGDSFEIVHVTGIDDEGNEITLKCFSPRGCQLTWTAPPECWGR